MTKGRVKRWLDDRDYGFITSDDDGEVVFVHARQLRGAAAVGLVEGQRVQFEVGTNERNRKREAQNVVVIG